MLADHLLQILCLFVFLWPSSEAYDANQRNILRSFITSQNTI